jgi:hypothetical protein
MFQANDSKKWIWYNILEQIRGKNVCNNRNNRRKTGSRFYSRRSPRLSQKISYAIHIIALLPVLKYPIKVYSS